MLRSDLGVTGHISSRMAFTDITKTGPFISRSRVAVSYYATNA